MGQCLSIWIDPIPLLSREARPQCSKLFRAKREPVTEVTEEPQVITTTGLWQPQVGTICASSRAQESIFLCSLWQEPFPALWSRAGCKVQSRAESLPPRGALHVRRSAEPRDAQWDQKEPLPLLLGNQEVCSNGLGNTTGLETGMDWSYPRPSCTAQKGRQNTAKKQTPRRGAQSLK